MVRFAITMVKVFGEEYLRYICCMYGYSMISWSICGYIMKIIRFVM